MRKIDTIFITIKRDRDNQIIMTDAELEDIIYKAYDKGYADCHADMNIQQMDSLAEKWIYQDNSITGRPKAIKYDTYSE